MSSDSESFEQLVSGDDGALMRRWVAVGLVTPPWIVTGSTLLLAPQYLDAFLKHPIGLGLMSFALVTNIFSWWLMARSKSLYVWTAVFFLLVIPQTLVPMLGPAVMPIIRALGPIFNGFMPAE